MHVAAVILGCLFLGGVAVDAFQTIILPRRPVGRLRITRVFFLLTWGPWKWIAGRLSSRKLQEAVRSIYGPAALLMLFVLWAVLLVMGFTLVFFGMHAPFNDPLHAGVAVTHWMRLRTCFYVSGTTIFTLGLGDVTPVTIWARVMVIVEAGTGLGFVALVIGYVPVLYNTFSAREIAVALLDARAGSPPTAGELLERHSFSGGHHALTVLLAEWERWCATMLETHISYPILCYYRSQHDNQSWLSALTTVLDACALLIAAVDEGADAGGASTRQAQLTFAIGRHTLVDLGHVFHLEAREKEIREAPATRLDAAEFSRLGALLTPQGGASRGIVMEDDHLAQERLAEMRRMYEPQAEAIAEFLCLELPMWMPPAGKAKKHDAWATVASLRLARGLSERLSSHVSVRSTASHLHDDESHPL